MGATSIEWTDATWNPVRGCSRVSEGCRNCYAERIAARFSKPGAKFFTFANRRAHGGPHSAFWTGKVALIPEKLDEPIRWKKPRRIFVNSMSDLFHEALSFEEITAVYGAMAAAPQHTFQVLTKRPARRKAWAEWIAARGGLGPFIRSDEGRPALRDFYAAGTRTEVYRGQTVRSSADAWAMVMNAAACIGSGRVDNVWEGVSVEDQATADERIPLLLQTPAAVRFVSYEPGLAAVDFSAFLWADLGARGRARLNRLNWIIVGGESGPGARRFNVEWARATVRQCREAGTAAFYKQGGASNRCPHDQKGGHFECFPPDLQVREFPRAA